MVNFGGDFFALLYCGDWRDAGSVNIESELDDDVGGSRTTIKLDCSLLVDCFVSDVSTNEIKYKRETIHPEWSTVDFHYIP